MKRSVPPRPALRRPPQRAQYPQVEPGALALAHRALAPCRGELSVAEGLRLLQRTRARLLVVGERDRIGVVRLEDLKRAHGIGLSERPVRDLAWRGVPMVAGAAPELRVRRLLRGGAPVVLISDRRGVVAAVEPSQLPGAQPPLSLAGRLDRQCSGETRELLHSIAKLAQSLGVRAYLAGGFVRDLLRGVASRDLDVVVEGDPLELAQRLCRQVGGNLVVHRAFVTASIEGWSGGRLDVVMARRERYATPGALPIVSPASIEEDLARRDFTMNAMAVGLVGPEFGRFLDPFGGVRDVEIGRIRILHPLSFVEDPTRIFRAVRYAARLGFGIDRWSRDCLGVALRLAPYPALSGQRLLAEIELVMREPGWERSLRALARVGAFRLLDPSYRFSRLAEGRLRDLTHLLEWDRAGKGMIEPVPLALLCLVGHLPRAVAERALRRLALSGEPLARLTEALAEGPLVARRLEEEANAPASRRAALLRSRSIETLGYAWLAGSPAARDRIRWFLSEGRNVRAALSGEELLALGVPRGPAVSKLLDRLRDERLDGLLASREDEVRRVGEWKARAGRGTRGDRGGLTWRPSSSS